MSVTERVEDIILNEAICHQASLKAIRNGRCEEWIAVHDVDAPEATK
ncbi:MAG: hypothetical protein M3345_07205 [Actinomycetota bacterium]|nr:hypothetical protein [Actinomycetota bacterium]